MDQNAEHTISTQSEIGQLGDINSAVAPISSLPNELLEDIFSEYARIMGSQAWIGILLVCRRWTNVALNHGKLWTAIRYYSSEDRDRTQIRLRRSKDSPLSCFFNCEEEEDIIMMTEVLLKHGPRIRSLYVCMDSERELEEVVHKMLRNIKKFPKLEEMALRFLYLPEFDLSGGLQLRNISLIGIWLTGWNHWHLFKLTELTLRVDEDDSPPVTVDEFLSFLRCSPRLRTLDLEYHLPIPRAVGNDLLSPDADNKVHLSHLKRLRLHDNMQKIHFLLQSLTIPSTCSLRIKIKDVELGSDMLGLLKSIRLHLRGNGAPVFRAVAIITEESEDGPFVRVGADTAASDYTWSNSVHFILTATLDTHREAHRLIFKILDAIPLESTRHLQIVLDQHIEILSLQVWRAIFQRLPHLEVIAAEDRHMLQVLKGLTDSVQRGVGGLSGRKRRRAAYCGLTPPTRLHVSVPYVYEEDPSEVSERFGALAEPLAAFKAMEAPFKPAGVPLGTLDIKGIKRDHVSACGLEPLCSLVGQLLIEGQPWNPATQPEGGVS